MKYIVVDETRGDIFSKEFNNVADAIRYADLHWSYTTESDKCSAFYVLESQNPDEEAPDHFDGSVIRTYK